MVRLFENLNIFQLLVFWAVVNFFKKHIEIKKTFHGHTRFHCDNKNTNIVFNNVHIRDFND